ncbi:MAG: enoyl-CoA hydratase [Thermoanaerobaculia bacterium]
MGGRIRTERDGALGWLFFDQPARRNAISVEMWEQLPGAVAAFAADPGVRVVGVRGAGGDAFIAGADISQFEQQRTEESAVARYGRLAALGLGALANLEKPLLACIEGPCIGGGVVVALAADLRYASDDAVFRIPAARLGIGYEVPAVAALAATVGLPAAMDLLLTARRIDAGEAKQIGLVHAVRPRTELEAFVREQADRIAGNAPLTLRALKLAARELRKPEAVRNFASAQAAYRACFDSADYREDVAAFLGKRKPRFEGR